MPSLLILPVPCLSSSISLGQLLTDPLDPTSTSFRAPTEQAGEKCVVQTLYQDTISRDDKGRFTLSGKRSSPNDVIVNAKQSTRHSLTSPNTAFRVLSNDTATQSFFHQAAILNKPLYFVTSIQKLTNATFHLAIAKQGSIAEATCAGLPIPVRRDSATQLLQNHFKEEIIFAIGLTKVRCRVGAANEPHSLDDLDYGWSYHPVEESDEQLSVGLGKAVVAAEWREVVGIAGEEEEEEEEEDGGCYTYFSDDDAGFAGF